VNGRLWMSCALPRMDASFCCFRVTLRVSTVRIRVRVGMLIPEYRYGKNATTDGKNRYGQN